MQSSKRAGVFAAILWFLGSQTACLIPDYEKSTDPMEVAAAVLALLGSQSGSTGSAGGSVGGSGTGGGAGATTAPAAPTNLTATPGNGQLALTWDSVSGAAEYSVLYGTTTALGSTVTGVTTAAHSLTGLANFQTYYVAVRAHDGSQASGNSNVASGRPVKNLIIFGTTSTFGGGNLGGCAGADNSCTNDAGKPNTSTYRAMLDGCTSALQTSAAYYRSDGTTLIATTNASGALPATLTNAIVASSTPEFVTGHSGGNCSAYTNGTSGSLGIGIGTSTTAWWSNGNETCNQGLFLANRLYCVEQP